MKIKQIKFKVGDERVNDKGFTVRLCTTATGKEQWRKVGEDGEVVKRGSRAGSPLLVDTSLESIVQHLAGAQAVEAIRKAGGESALEVNLPVSAKWVAPMTTHIAAPKAIKATKGRKGVTVETV